MLKVNGTVRKSILTKSKALMKFIHSLSEEGYNDEIY